MLFLFGMAGHASAATYYVLKADYGSGVQLQYQSGAWPTSGSHLTTPSPNNITQILAIRGANNTFVLDGGIIGVTYTDGEIGASNYLSVQANNQTLRGPVSTDPDYASHSGTVKLTCTATDCILNGSKTGFALSNLTLYGPGEAVHQYAVNQSTTAMNMTDVVIDNWGMAYVNQSNDGSTSTHTRVTIRNSGNVAQYTIRATANSTTIWNYPIIYSNSPSNGSFLIQISAAASMTFNNPTFYGNVESILTSAGAAVFNNAIF